jgi:S-adenosylmethionine hydrolase
MTRKPSTWLPRLAAQSSCKRAISAGGVGLALDPTLRLENTTREIPPFNIWKGACRLARAVLYWPPGSVFVAVIGPGAGTGCKSMVFNPLA